MLLNISAGPSPLPNALRVTVPSSQSQSTSTSMSWISPSRRSASIQPRMSPNGAGALDPGAAWAGGAPRSLAEDCDFWLGDLPIAGWLLAVWKLVNGGRALYTAARRAPAIRAIRRLAETPSHFG